MIEWRKIPGFPNYEVSNTGFVRNGHKIIEPNVVGMVI